MEEKLLKDILLSLQEIKENLKVTQVAHFPGTVGDPGPEINPHFRNFERFVNFRGPVADPGPWQILDKDKLARIKVARLERYIDEINKEIEIITLERDLIKQQYKF
jgi:hypothetical protein